MTALCSCVTGFDPDGSVAKGTDLIRCGKPASPCADTWDLNLCPEHQEMFLKMPEPELP